jgi:hypothetical protein
MVEGKSTAAIELSALRDVELERLVSSLDELPLAQFDYISFHAPSRFETISEADAINLMQPVFARGWPTIVHPDAIHDWDRWSALGELICIENMDKRKPIGRTAIELKQVFSRLPKARFCFDIAHARQVDPTMVEARTMLRDFRSRLCQIHLSYVASSSQHEPLNFGAILAYQQLASEMPADVPIILEAPIAIWEMDAEIERAKRALFRN